MAVVVVVMMITYCRPDDVFDLPTAYPNDWTNMIGLDGDTTLAIKALGAAIAAVSQYPVHFEEGDLS